jgi:hypothetical protein
MSPQHSFATRHLFTDGEDLLIVGKNNLTHCEVTNVITSAFSFKSYAKIESRMRLVIVRCPFEG